MNAATLNRINLGGRRVDYRLVRSKAARKLRVRVGPGGMEVVHPAGREEVDVESFLQSNAQWIIGQLDRVERFRPIRRLHRNQAGEILYRGAVMKIRVQEGNGHHGANKVVLDNADLVIIRGGSARTSPARTLENWLRKQARQEIHQHIDTITPRLKRSPHKVYVMGQRTKWGNCSPLRNLSFNWRLILAPDFVLRYLVTHEVVHLAVPDHSARFWLTVHSLCPNTQKAKRWLSANGDKLFVDLENVCLSPQLG